MEVLKDLKGFTAIINVDFDLDGTEIYGEDGQTVADITELDSMEILEILDIKKELPKQP